MTGNYLEFIETRVFSKARQSLLADDQEFQELQIFLLEHHESGDTISQTGGCKKIRWSRAGMGKRGGTRIIYYTRLSSGRIYLLLIYPKNVKDDLNEAEKALLKVFTQQINL
ncbi:MULTISPECIES: type II toxin-antitoxin system RelE/ParE family toxin [Pantoea]|uniref:type II toxin-antitoxin system RelE/ParE family toxin n=1 Tax=Pantoea TaxID=53335 RepID=UPI000CE2BE80|nr:MULTISPECIES: type II toxin-antitoxin system RelE/ParE family toxin [Pantoea]KAA6099978.1 type II toxin-antitoxin system RelE/ParE family toxin [Pantoea sp. B_9]KAA6117222.1 type II toxin-antitoxin system RelE/ParE family toxin [Pantoea sp. B_10]KAA8673571.1 type II toxin-antitoxin system RelE/ParE family toxin [Pantoea dispersa]NIG33603.1 type II toxin-antitoxin system RelE/ParE family toxin [Pantoea sp. Ap-959]PPC69451.1 toxin HigB-2 [Pantoea sp. ICBG 828]